MEDQKYLIVYDNGSVLGVTEAPDSGVIYSNRQFIIDTLANAKVMLNAAGVDYTEFTLLTNA